MSEPSRLNKKLYIYIFRHLSFLVVNTGLYSDTNDMFERLNPSVCFFLGLSLGAVVAVYLKRRVTFGKIAQG